MDAVFLNGQYGVSFGVFVKRASLPVWKRPGRPFYIEQSRIICKYLNETPY